MKSRLIPTVVTLILAASPTLAQDSGMAAGKEMMAVQKQMMKDMEAMKPTNDPDADFVMMMIPHHQAAIDMAKVQLKYGKEMELQALAKKIIADQEREIAEMKKWQETHGK